MYHQKIKINNKVLTCCDHTTGDVSQKIQHSFDVSAKSDGVTVFGFQNSLIQTKNKLFKNQKLIQINQLLVV